MTVTYRPGAVVVERPRESKEWVEVAVSTTVDGVAVTAGVQFALLRPGVRPQSSDWFSPVADPDGGSKIGIQLMPVASPVKLGLWVRVAEVSEAPVLEPSEVGYIVRL